jgi:hypothetical protein
MITRALHNEMVKDILTRNDGLFPFYRETICGLPAASLNGLNASGFGAEIRRDWGLWEAFPSAALDVSKKLLDSVWVRLN